MLFKSVTAMAVFAVAAHAASEPMPYKPLMKMSIHQMFGLGRRQTDGYKPTESTCSDGATCAEACGAGFVTCPSTKDALTHCFNPEAKQICCPDNSGNSCDDGYYCTADTTGETWCCPNNLDLVACAAAYSVTGGLVSEAPQTSTTSTSSSSTSSAALITTTSSSISVTTITSSSSSSSSSSVIKNATITSTSISTTTTCTSTIASSATWGASNMTIAPAFVSATPSPSPAPASVSISGAGVAGPAALLSMLAAAAFAVLL